MKTGKMLLFIVAAGLLGGCQNTVNTVENSEKSATPTTIVDKRYVTDGFLKDRLALRSVRMSPAASGNMMVEVSATNVRVGGFAQVWSSLTGEVPYSVDYKFSWQNEAGMTVETPLAGWRTMVIHPGETVQFKAIAPDSRCKDFVLNLKESK